MLLINFSTQEKELPSKNLQQFVFNTKPKTEEHVLIVMDKSTHEEHLSHSL